MSIRDAYRNAGFYCGDRFGTKPETLAFHQVVLASIQKAKDSIDAAGKFDARKEFRDEVRLQKQSVALRKANHELRKTVEAAAKGLQAPVESLRSELAQAARGPVPKSDPMAALLNHLEVVELRRQIESIPETSRGKVLMGLAGAGNPYLMPALDGALRPLTGLPVMDAIREIYVNATQKPLVSRLEEAEENESEVLAIMRQVSTFVEREAKTAGLEKAWETTINPAAGLNDAQKAAFISRHGLEAYQLFTTAGIVPQYPKEHSLSRHPEATTFDELVHQVGTPEAATTWLLEKRLPENWNPPEA